MDPRIKVICDRFEYNNSILLVDLFQIWQDKLEVEINKFKNSDCIFIVSNDLETTLKSIEKLDKDEKIPTDCRFFSLFIGNLVENPLKKSIIRMMFNFNSFIVVFDDSSKDHPSYSAHSIDANFYLHNFSLIFLIILCELKLKWL